ncbi:MAG: acyloxyacyl hydrolase [Methylacidiphilales bacterium]|nr:acyloxyacyl hydrolase [Candidatus Methylacidiphilales bacterium]
MAVFLLPLAALNAQQAQPTQYKANVAVEPFHENKIEISVESANLFDIGSTHTYHLAPQTVSLHWQLDDVGNQGWLRGNTEWIFSGYYTPVIEGPENRFTGALFGPRYNFVQPGWKWVPYVGSRVGFGFTDSTGVLGAQGQDFCFSFAVDVGVRYIINDTVDISIGGMYEHYSNAGLSEPTHQNNGLDSAGPNVALNFKF